MIKKNVFFSKEKNFVLIRKNDCRFFILQLARHVLECHQCYMFALGHSVTLLALDIVFCVKCRLQQRL